MNIPGIETGIAGRYRLQVQKNGVITKDTGWFKNLITNAGMDSLGEGPAGGIFENLYQNGSDQPRQAFARWYVGAGNAAPAYADTVLQSPIASVAVGEYKYWTHTVIDGFVKAGTSVTFGEGVAAGNISEVGIGHNDGRATLFSRALVKDSNGLPTTVTVLSDESLIMSWEIYLKIPEADITHTLGDGTVVTFRPSVLFGNYSNTNGWGPCQPRSGLLLTQAALCRVVESDVFVATSSTTPLNGGSGGSSITYQPYVAGSYSRTYTVFYNTTEANFATGIGMTTVFFGGGIFQCRFQPKIMKTSVHTLKLTFTGSWGRYEGVLP